MERRTKTPQRKEPSRRYARESQQEDRSEGQIFERFAELGWPRSRMGRDLGEDLLVQIYDEGRATGLSFYVQLKSAANAERLRRKKSPALAYPLEVKDLIHWEVSTTLVFLVIWDVERHEGWWQSVPEILKGLDEAKKGWRKRKTATVTVPLTNATDDEGMARLRWAVADHCLPVIPKQDNIVSLTFGNSEQGAEARRALEKAMDLGEAIPFEHEFIPAMNFPAWHRRVYGAVTPGELVKIAVTPSPDKTTKTVRIEIESTEGPAALPYVELRRSAQGRKRLVLTNEHQKLPIIFSFNFENEHAKLGFKQIGLGKSLHEAQEVAAFMLAGAAPGAIIRIIDLEDGRILASPTSAPGNSNYDPVAMRRWRDLLDKICFVQQRARHHGTFSMAALSQMTTVDAEAIECAFQILREGKAETVKTMSFNVLASAEHIPDERCSVRVDFNEVHINVLGLDIPLGNARTTIVDSDRYMNAIRAARAQANATGKAVSVHLENLHFIEEYLDWLPGRLPWPAMYDALDHLAEMSGQRGGYFTRGDARSAGASDPIFEALLTEKKIERVAADVYHLAQFPRAEREDLLVLWLQTDREGVLSHETALSLHDLCDILPAHLHITVPLGWTSRDRALESDVEIRHADIPEADLRWLGAVPYTSALRTLRDCIEVGVSPELIEQAIAEGIRRGLFAAADLPPQEHARSA